MAKILKQLGRRLISQTLALGYPALLLFFLGSRLGADWSSNLDRSLAQARLEQAQKAFEAGQPAQAEAILAAAKEFSEGYADYYALLGRVRMGEGLAQAAAGELEQALRLYQPGGLYARAEIVKNLYHVYSRLRRHRDLLALIDREGLSNADARSFRIRALMRTGQPALAKREARLAMQLYPADYRFYLPFFADAGFPAEFFTAFRRLSRVEGRPIADSAERSVFYAALLRAPEGPLRAAMFDAAYPWLKNDLNYWLYCQTNSVAVPENFEPLAQKELASLYIDADLAEKAKAAGLDFDVQRYVNQGAALGRDFDLDGYPDQRASLSGDSGYWAFDPRQEGVDEIRVNYSQGQITDIQEIRGNKRLAWFFDEYPAVSRVELVAEERKLVYSLLPGRLSLKPDRLEIWSESATPAPVFSRREALPSEAQILSNAFRIDEFYNESHFRRLRVLNGEIIAIFEDSNGFGRFDRYLELKNWQVAAGRRDALGNGRFDVYELYKNGVWLGLAFSEDGGRPAYYEDWRKGSIKVWDFDKDGYVNAYTRSSSSGRMEKIEPRLLRRMKPQDLLVWSFEENMRWFNAQTD